MDMDNGGDEWGVPTIGYSSGTNADEVRWETEYPCQ